MKILHVFDVAGVANLLAKFMDRLCHTESYVISRKVYDELGLSLHTKPLNSGAKMFYVRALLKARNYDVIHVHARDRIVPFFKRIYGKPVILSYYGTDIRGMWAARRKYWSHADRILYSTQDLLTSDTPKEAIWFPCPIDTDLFYPKNEKRRTGDALTFNYNADDLASKCALDHNLVLTISKRNVPYEKVADVLSQYEYYIDVKRSKEGEVSEAVSKTGLEALACGCKVIRWDGQIIKELPKEHNAEYAARTLHNMCQDLLSRS